MPLNFTRWTMRIRFSTRIKEVAKTRHKAELLATSNYKIKGEHSITSTLEIGAELFKLAGSSEIWAYSTHTQLGERILLLFFGTEDEIVNKLSTLPEDKNFISRQIMIDFFYKIKGELKDNSVRFNKVKVLGHNDNHIQLDGTIGELKEDGRYIPIHDITMLTITGPKTSSTSFPTIYIESIRKSVKRPAENDILVYVRYGLDRLGIPNSSERIFSMYDLDIINKIREFIKSIKVVISK